MLAVYGRCHRKYPAHTQVSRFVDFHSFGHVSILRPFTQPEVVRWPRLLMLLQLRLDFSITVLPSWSVIVKIWSGLSSTLIYLPDAGCFRDEDLTSVSLCFIVAFRSWRHSGEVGSPSGVQRG